MHLPVSYPRISGVLVPASLAQAGCSAGRPGDAGGNAGDRAQVAGEVVAWLRRAQRRLPAALLDSELPTPNIILNSWVIGTRTRGSLERILSTPQAAKMRRVRDYVGAERLGVHGLVDLLAAREEQEAPALPLEPTAPTLAAPAREAAAMSASRLEELSTAIRDHLPLRPGELGDAVAASGFKDDRLTFDGVVRLYRQRNVAAPFRVVRRGGATVLVATESLGAAETLLANAGQCVFNWGVCTVEALLERLQALTGATLDPRAATRILAAVPRFRWLDEAAGWFSFAEYSTRLDLAVRKVFAVAERVRLDELSRALAKVVELVATVSRRAIATYLSDVVGCEIRDGWVRRAATPAIPLDRGERALVEVLQRSGGEATMRTLQQQAAVTARALRDVARTSPLVLASAHGLRLIGAAPVSLASPSSRRPPAAPMFAPRAAPPRGVVPSPAL